jgi:hypothetical protein
MIKLEIDYFEDYIDTKMEEFSVYKNIIRIINLYKYSTLHLIKNFILFLPNIIRLYTCQAKIFYSQTQIIIAKRAGILHLYPEIVCL